MSENNELDSESTIPSQSKEVAEEPLENTAELDPDSQALEDGDPDGSEEEEEAPADTDEEGEDDEGEGDEEPGEKAYEFNFMGNKLDIVGEDAEKLPLKLAEKVQEFVSGVESGNTKKSQELSALRQTVEKREESFFKLKNMNDQTLNVYAQGLAIQKEIDQLQKDDQGQPIDFNRLWTSNPDEARRRGDLINKKTGEFQATVNTVNNLEGQMNKAMNEENVRRYAEGEALVEQKIPGFKANIAPKVVAYAMERFGIPQEHAVTWPLNVPAAIAMYESMLWHNMKKKAKNKTQPNKIVLKDTTSAARDGTKRKARKAGAKGKPNPGALSPDEYEEKFLAGEIK